MGEWRVGIQTFYIYSNLFSNKADVNFCEILKIKIMDLVSENLLHPLLKFAILY